MFTMILQAVREDAGELSILATKTVEGAPIVPKRGDQLVMRTPSRGDADADLIKVDSVFPLISLDGYVVNFRFVTSADAAPLHLEERRLRSELANLGWTLVAPQRPVDLIEYDEDDYEGLHAF